MPRTVVAAAREQVLGARRIPERNVGDGDPSLGRVVVGLESHIEHGEPHVVVELPGHLERAPRLGDADVLNAVCGVRRPQEGVTDVRHAGHRLPVDRFDRGAVEELIAFADPVHAERHTGCGFFAARGEQRKPGLARHRMIASRVPIELAEAVG